MDQETNHPFLPEQPSDHSVPSTASFDVTKLFLPVAIMVAAGLISGTLLYVNYAKSGTQLPPGEKGEAKVVDVSVDDDPVLGKNNAPVTIVEFSDFQCPFCRKFWEGALGDIKKEYIDTGKARLVYRDFPLDFHLGAQPAAEAGECAHEQGKFWELHDKIFASQAKKGEGTIQFTVADLKQWSKGVGLDGAKFNACLDAGKYKEEVAKDVQDGAAAGVSGTPTIFINGRAVVGAQPFAVFKAIIEAELAKK